MTKLPFQATPGIIIVTPVEEKQSQFTVTGQKTGRIIQGKVVSVGDYDTTTNGEKVDPARFCKVGDLIWFLHYYDEGGVDVMEVEGKKYYCVKLGDIRARI